MSRLAYFCIATVFTFVVFETLSSSKALPANGATTLFPDTGCSLSSTSLQSLAVEIERRFPIARTKKKILVYVTATCTSCSLGPNVSEVGEFDSQIQVIYAQDFPPHELNNTKHRYFFSDPEKRLVNHSDSSCLPKMLVRDISNSHVEPKPLTEADKTDTWRKK